MSLLTNKVFDPLFSKSWSSSAELEILLPTKNQDGRTELPVDVPSVGDPIRGSPKKAKPFRIYFLTNKTPSVFGPQWLETVQPA